MSTFSLSMLKFGIGNIITGSAILGILLVLKSIFFGTMFGTGMFIGCIFLGLAITGYGYGLKEIPATPPSAGLLTIWGKRTETALKEGYHLLAPYYPFFIDAIIINMTTVNQDFVSKFFCKVSEEKASTDGKEEAFKAGIQVSLSSAITWRPDAKRLTDFINNKSEAGVKNILDDILPQVLRIEGTKRTFETLTAGKEDLINAIIALLVNEDYATLEKEQKAAFKNEMKKNGKEDILGLGITIFKVNIGEPEPGEGSKKDIEGLAKEQFQRRSEVYEVETEIEQARKLFLAYQQANENRTLHDCILEIRRRKSMREGHGSILEIPGIEALGPVIGSVVAGVAAVAKNSASNTKTTLSNASGNVQQPRKRKQKPL